RKAPHRHRDHLVADLEAADPGSDPNHPPVALPAEAAAAARVEAERVEHVPEIQRRRLDLDLHLAGADALAAAPLDLEVSQAPPAAREEREPLAGILDRNRDEAGGVAVAPSVRHTTPPVPPPHLLPHLLRLVSSSAP